MNDCEVDSAYAAIKIDEDDINVMTTIGVVLFRGAASEALTYHDRRSVCDALQSFNVVNERILN